MKTIKDTTIRDNFELIFGLVFSSFSSMAEVKETSYTEEKYIADPNSIYKSYSSFKYLQGEYEKGIIAFRKYSNSGMVDNLVIQAPFEFPFYTKTEWKEVKFERDIKIKVTESYNEHIIQVQIAKPLYHSTNPDDLSIYYNLENRENLKESDKYTPLFLEGILKTEIPDTLIQVQFSKEDIGKTKVIRNTRIKLLKMEGSLV